MPFQEHQQTSLSLKLLNGRAGEGDLRVQMRTGRGPQEMGEQRGPECPGEGRVH